MILYPEATTQYLTDTASGLKTHASRVSYRQTLRALQFAYPEYLLEDFTEADLVYWCSRPGLSPATIAGYRTRIHGLFSWALWKGHITKDPSAFLERIVKGSFTKPVRENNWLSTADVRTVLESIDTSTFLGLRDMIIARLGFTLGLRRAEIAGLTWDQIDLDRQQVTIKGKGGRIATLFLTDESLPWFEQLYEAAKKGLGLAPLDEPVIPRFGLVSRYGTHQIDLSTGGFVPNWRRPVGPDTITKRILLLSQQTTRFAPHDMRRSYAGMLEEAGYTIEEISVALRHSDLGTTQRYLERRQDAAFQTVKVKGLPV